MLRTISVWQVSEAHDDSLIGLFVDKVSAEMWVADNDPETCVIEELLFSESEFARLKALIHSKDN